eukprot:238339-Prorocentrum_minimum.AAC.1
MHVGQTVFLPMYCVPPYSPSKVNITVEAEDTLGRLAARFGTSVPALQKANNMHPWQVIEPLSSRSLQLLVTLPPPDPS